MPKHHGQARAAYALASAGIPFDTPQTNLPPLIGICRANPGALRKTCPPVSAFGRVFFRVGFFARLNVPFTVSAHFFMARQCFSTARLRQQLVLAGPLRATRARLQPTSSTFVELASIYSGYSRPIARWPKPAGFSVCLMELRKCRVVGLVQRCDVILLPLPAVPQDGQARASFARGAGCRW